jgi:hypothetical protein
MLKPDRAVGGNDIDPVRPIHLFDCGRGGLPPLHRLVRKPRHRCCAARPRVKIVSLHGADADGVEAEVMLVEMLEEAVRRENEAAEEGGGAAARGRGVR